MRILKLQYLIKMTHSVERSPFRLMHAILRWSCIFSIFIWIQVCPDSQQNSQKPQGKYIPPNEMKYVTTLGLALCSFFMK